MNEIMERAAAWQECWHQTGAEFGATYAAEHFLSARGFSIGPMQRDAPRGILFGDFVISKWRNLHSSERSDLHGVMIYPPGHSPRNGAVIVKIWETAPVQARVALSGSK